MRKIGSLAFAGGVGLALSRIAFASQFRAQVQAPLRLICYSFPNGCQPELWNFSESLMPLVNMREQVHVFKGVRNAVVENAFGDGHELGGASLFTGGVALQDGLRVSRPSLDHVVGSFANSTVFRKPLVTGVRRGFAGGFLRSTTWKNRSWDFSGASSPFEANPLALLSEYFGVNNSGNNFGSGGDSVVTQQILRELNALKQSPAVFSSDVIQSIEIQIEKLREVENEAQRIEAERRESSACKVPESISIEGVNEKTFSLSDSLYEPVFRKQCELTVAAFQCDLVRTASLMFGNSGDDYFAPGIRMGDHDTSHYSSPESESIYRSYRRLHMKNLARLVSDLSQVPDIDGSKLIDNTIILVGSEFGDGRSHIISPQPLLIVGGQNVLTKGKEWDFELGQTPSHVYATVEEVFRRHYGVSAEQAPRNFLEESIAGLAKHRPIII